MQIIYFETRRDDHLDDDLHRQVVAEMRTLAESIDGFVRWRDVDDDLDYWGIVMFASEAAALTWKSHPDHARIHTLTAGTLYRSFSTRAFEEVRENHLGPEVTGQAT